jgi:hypothetical protein
MSTRQVSKRPPGDLAKIKGINIFKPQTVEDAMTLASIMAKTRMVPDQYRDRPEDIFVAWQLGDSVGLSMMQAVQGIAVINGRPTIWGDAALAVVLASGLVENYKEMTFQEIEEAGKAVFWVKRRGIDEPIIREFSIEDAKRAKLWQNPKKLPWVHYWPRMCQMRSRAFGLRDGFSDVLKGLSISEEMQDVIEVTATHEAPETLAVPRRLPEGESVESKPTPEIPADYTGPLCQKCDGEMKFWPDGVSKKDNKPYKAFWICGCDPEKKYSIRDSDWQKSKSKSEPTEEREPGIEG